MTITLTREQALRILSGLVEAAQESCIAAAWDDVDMFLELSGLTMQDYYDWL